jgi:hypothetical protein
MDTPLSGAKTPTNVLPLSTDSWCTPKTSMFALQTPAKTPTASSNVCPNASSVKSSTHTVTAVPILRPTQFPVRPPSYIPRQPPLTARPPPISQGASNFQTPQTVPIHRPSQLTIRPPRLRLSEGASSSNSQSVRVNLSNRFASPPLSIPRPRPPTSRSSTLTAAAASAPVLPVQSGSTASASSPVRPPPNQHLLQQLDCVDADEEEPLMRDFLSRKMREMAAKREGK